MRAGFGFLLGILFACSIVPRLQLGIAASCLLMFLVGVAWAALARRITA